MAPRRVVNVSHTKTKTKKDNEIKKQKELIINQKTEEVISSMPPVDLVSLVSPDGRYIKLKLIKAKDIPISPSRPRKEKKVKEKKYKENKHKEKGVEKERVQTTRREKENEKEIQPITGPFECLQPSASAGGTCQQTFSSCCEYSAHVRDKHARPRRGRRGRGGRSCQVCEKPLAGGGDRAYSCEVCGAGFDSGYALLKHQKAHEKQPFVCDICYKQFTQKGNLEMHMRIHTGDRPFKCKHCEKAFTQKSHLNQHELIHTKEKPHRCVVCSKMFSHPGHLRDHMRTHTQVSPFQCVLCQKRFKASSQLKSHLKTHIKVSQMFSNEGQTVDSSIAQRRVDTKIKAEDTPEGASIPSRKRKAEKEKAQTSRREKEKEIQPITGPFECLHPSAIAEGPCQQTFSSCCEYSAHVRDKHTRPRRGLRCQVCEKPFAGGDNRSYICKVCGAGFDSGYALLRHQKAHEEQPLVCDICYKQFTRKSSIVIHMLIHTGDRPFKCKYCKKAFNRKSSLTQHVRIHTKEKPYHCVVCSEMFSHPTALRRHMRTHTQVSPFQCVLCQKRFKQSSTFKNHLKTHITVSQMFSNEEQTVVPGEANTSITEVSNEPSVEGGEEVKEETIEDEVEGGEEGVEGTEEVYDQEELKEETIEEDEVCGAGFDSGEALLKHQKAHEKQPFICNICYKVFTLKGNMKTHMRIHTGDRPFKCKYCKKAFNQKSNLNKHVRIHTGDRPFKCKYCKKAFNQKSNLNKHVRIHTKEKP